ncbi:CbtA family protein, partial [Leptospira sp. SA-E8]|uniref:CbtA family protein n=1 Tax=Leptospira sp. SA-E8 TaxID=3422259 RepID=UPI003EBDC1FB
MIFQRLIWAALAVALVVGSVQTGVQSLQATPLILAAEVYEGQKAEAPAPAETSATHTHAEGVAAHDHEHG